MKFGVREICDVVLKAKATQKIGKRVFYPGEPVIYFDTLKTSSMEGAATTVYAQGGRGNSRLVAWEGERTVTFTMEDALISPEGFMILSGAGLIDASASKPIFQHMTEVVDGSLVKISGEGDDTEIIIPMTNEPYLGDWDEEAGFTAPTQNMAYVMFKKNDEIISEPYIPRHEHLVKQDDGMYHLRVNLHDAYDFEEGEELEDEELHQYRVRNDEDFDDFHLSERFDSVMIDFYVARTGNAQQIEITADKFGGNYYLEASTLFRDQKGVDMPAEFIIPNCKIQSNFTFTMASSGDPSTFTFTMDAFPDYTRFDHSKKVLAAIQIIKEAGSMELHRHSTYHEEGHEKYFM